MTQQEREIVSQLIRFTEQGIVAWHPTDIDGVYYTEYTGIPYIIGTDSIALDDSHECYAYFVSVKRDTWEHVAYAQEDDISYELDKTDEPIRRLYSIAAKQSSGREKISIKQRTSNKERQSEEQKRPKIFISHTSRDTLFIKALVHLFEQQGFSKEDIFCSSVPGYGIKLGGNIFDVLLEQFQKYNLFMIFVHSPRFYRRPISLNEMGAAWALKTQYFSILTRDMSYDDMRGVVTNRDVALKVDEANATYRTIELIHQLQDEFGKEYLEEEVTKRNCEEFIQYVNSLSYTRWGEVSPKQIWKVYLENAMIAIFGMFGIKID